jgi:hypothetical protein
MKPPERARDRARHYNRESCADHHRKKMYSTPDRVMGQMLLISERSMPAKPSRSVVRERKWGKGLNGQGAFVQQSLDSAGPVKTRRMAGS